MSGTLLQARSLTGQSVRLRGLLPAQKIKDKNKKSHGIRLATAISAIIRSRREFPVTDTDPVVKIPVASRGNPGSVCSHPSRLTALSIIKQRHPS